MSSKSAKMHERFRLDIPPEPGDFEIDGAIEWRADWGGHCELCGQTPCVAGFSGGVIVVDATRCAECLDADASARLAIGNGW